MEILTFLKLLYLMSVLHAGWLLHADPGFDSQCCQSTLSRLSPAVGNYDMQVSVAGPVIQASGRQESVKAFGVIYHLRFLLLLWND